MVVSTKVTEGVAVVTIENPPVNATSHAVRQGLQDVLAETSQDDAVRSVVLHCAGKTFVAGADVTEFGKPSVEPSLPDLLDQIEAAPKPWIAAIHGTALGGGLELALVCQFRIADRAAKLGLPEVNLGLIPGAGGTVRLPRLIPIDKALDMIATGKPVTAGTALQMGLIDNITDGDLLKVAIDMAQNITATSDPIRQRAVIPPSAPDAMEAVTNRVKKKARGQRSPVAAIQAIENTQNMAAAEAFAAERALFLELRESTQSKALRHVFFAERATSRIDSLKGISPQALSRIGVIGGGTMGAGIAVACLLAGYDVTMIEQNPTAVEAGQQRVTDTLTQSQERGILSPAKTQKAKDSFDVSTDYAALATSDMVIEAVFEDLDVKRDVLQKIDRVVGPHAIIASNTSYLDLNALAYATKMPSRVIGLHFFSPAHIMKLLEIVTPDSLDSQTLSTALAFAKRLRKIPVLSGVCDGFIANRIMSAYRREAEYMLEDGAMPWDIDQAMRDFGFPMGIFEMQDLAGLDISWAMRKQQAAARDPNQRYVDIGDKLCEAGHFGRKTARGYYDYAGSGRATPSKETEALVLAESKRKNIDRHALSSKAIMTRILKRTLSEAQDILAEGIARSPDDIDVVMINAFGFPRWKGGPLFMHGT